MVTLLLSGMQFGEFYHLNNYKEMHVIKSLLHYNISIKYIPCSICIIYQSLPYQIPTSTIPAILSNVVTLNYILLTHNLLVVIPSVVTLNCILLTDNVPVFTTNAVV